MIINASRLKKLLNKNLSQFVTEPEYKTHKVDPLELLTPNRLDIVSKYLFVKFHQLQIESDFAKDLYLDHINAFNGFVENDESQKIGKEAFLNSFYDLISSIKDKGFDDSNIIPLADDQTIIDGAHRIASSIYFGNPVSSVSLNTKQQKFNYEYFEQRGFKEDYLDAMALEYARLKDKTFMVIVWPTAENNDVELENILTEYGEIVYRKNLTLNLSGNVQLVKQAYRKETWLGSFKNDFEGARNKARWCFKEPGLVRAFLFESDLDLIAMKDEIRSIFQIEKHAVHINDTHDETIELAELLFNKNSIGWMNSSNLIEFKRFDELLSKYSSWFENTKKSKQDFTLIGAVLAAYGVRETKDLDYICNNNQPYDFGDEQIELETNKIKYSPVSVDELIYNPQYHFYAQGHKFVTLDIVKKIKEERKKGNDEEDVIMLDALIKNGRYSETFINKLVKIKRISFWKRNIKFILLKVRFLVLTSFKKIR